MIYLLEPQSDLRTTGGFIYNHRVSTRLPDIVGRLPVHAAGASDRRDALPDDAEGIIIDSLLLFDRRYAGSIDEPTPPCIAIGLIHYLPSDNPFLSAPEQCRRRRIEKQALARLSGCIVPSEYLGHRLRGAQGYRGPIRVVPPGVDERFREAVAERNRPPVDLVTVGAVVPEKGLSRGLVALSSLRGTRWRWTVVGSAASGSRYVSALGRAARKLGVSDRVRFAGPADGAGVLDALLSADLYLATSLQEGYGMAGAEALATGLPVVGYRVGGFGEVVKHGVTGYLANPRYPGSLGALLSATMGLRWAYEQIATGAVLYAKESRSWDTVAAGFVEAALSIGAETKHEKPIADRSVEETPLKSISAHQRAEPWRKPGHHP